ncbi:MAG TPA: hypothetical protein VKA10_12500, partial [Prolixibacteraceae bacterium]|nr:hypothetical protein [Prolixibacteraceae bacterium]
MHKHLPNIFLFNPACEYAVANGNKHWQPNSILQKMETDLSLLPLYLANPNDFVLVRKEISADFMESLQRLITHLPEIKLLKKAIKSHQ